MISLRLNVLRTLLAAFAFMAMAAGAAAQLLPIRQNGRWGLIDEMGTVIIKPRYEAVQPTRFRAVLVVEDGKYGLLDEGGKELIAPRFTFLKPITEHLWATNIGGDCDNGDCEGGKWGLLHIITQNELPPAYDLVLDAAIPGYVLANVGGDCDYQDCKGGKWSLIDTLGRVLLGPEYDRVNPLENRYAFILRDSLWGLYDLQTSQERIAPQYKSLTYINNRFLCGIRDGKASLLEQRRGLVFQADHADYRDGRSGHFQFQQGGKWGLIDSTGKRILSARYDQVLVESSAWIRVWRDGNSGLASFSGEEVAPPIYREVKRMTEGFALVSQGLAWGAINRKGDVIVPILYDAIGSSGDTLLHFRDRSMLKWADLSGKIVKGISFESAETFREGVARVRTAGKWGLINQEGNWVVPPRYATVNVFVNVAQARVGDGEWEYFYYDDNGRVSLVKRIVLMRSDEDDWDANPMMTGAGGVNFGALGWFQDGKRKWGLRNPSTGQVAIRPKYNTVMLIPRTDLTLVEGKIGETENTGLGIVNHVTCRETAEPMFERVFTDELAGGASGRAVYAGTGRYTIIQNNGQFANLGMVTFIRPFREDLAAACVGGRVVDLDVPRQDTIYSREEEIRNSSLKRKFYTVVEQGKWGYVDAAGKWVKAAEFEQALPFHNGLAPVKKGGKWGVIDTSFVFVVPPKYDFVEELSTERGKMLYTVGANADRYGFINEGGEVVVRPQFTEAGNYAESLVRIKQGKLWGFANMQGEVVVPANYHEVSDFHEGRARVRNFRTWGYIDAQGDAITPQSYLRAGDFHEGKAWVQSGRKFGYIGRDGQFVITPRYSEAADFGEGRAAVRQRNGYGIIDSTGKWVLQPKYYRIEPFQDGIAVVQDGSMQGIVRLDGSWLVKPNYRNLGAYAEGRAAFRSKLQYGYLDSAGKVTIPAQFANARAFSCGLAPVFIQGRWGYIDSTGTLVIPAQYSSAHGFYEDRAAVKVGDRWGFINKAGELVVPASYDKVKDFEQGRAAVLRNSNGWGFVNADGTLIIACAYDAVGRFQQDVVPVCINRKWGVLNKYGSLVTLLKYDNITDYAGGLAKVKIQRSIGVVDQTGKVIVPTDFDSVRLMGQIIQAEVNDEMGYLRQDGRWIWQPTK
jgi:hypothetical protein